MPETFTKLFASITESTVWMQPDPVRLVWITLLAMADREGKVFASIPGLANRARVELTDAEKALEIFSSPDPYSRTKEHEGRRLEAIDGGWRLLTYAKHRKMADHEAAKERKRKWWEENRGKSLERSSLEELDQSRHITEAEAEVLAKASTDAPLKRKRKPAKPRAPFRKPTVEEVEAHVRQQYPELLGEIDPVRLASKFVASNDTKGWVVGDTHTPMKDWKAAIWQWIDRRRTGEFS